MKIIIQHSVKDTLEINQDMRQNLISASEEAQQLLSDLNADRRD